MDSNSPAIDGSAMPVAIMVSNKPISDGRNHSHIVICVFSIILSPKLYESVGCHSICKRKEHQTEITAMTKTVERTMSGLRDILWYDGISHIRETDVVVATTCLRGSERTYELLELSSALEYRIGLVDHNARTRRPDPLRVD